MTAFAEFVGGPLDGTVRLIEDASDVHVPAIPPWRYEGFQALPETLCYRRSERRTVDAPTGEPVFRFALGP